MLRISNEIRKRIALILQLEMRDPRVVGIVTVLRIDVSKDLSYAKVYVTFLDSGDVFSEGQLNEKINILRGASGFIRSLLAKDMALRIVPELFFIHDDSMTASARIHNLLDKISMQY